MWVLASQDKQPWLKVLFFFSVILYPSIFIFAQNRFAKVLYEKRRPVYAVNVFVYYASFLHVSNPLMIFVFSVHCTALLQIIGKKSKGVQTKPVVH